MTLLNTSVYDQDDLLDRKISELLNILLGYLLYICLLGEMAAVPQGMFAARKVRENEEKLKSRNEICDLTPTKYSSKYMNSIWGMYNRYSVHNLKKNMDEKLFVFAGQQKEIVGPKQSVEKNSTDLTGSLSSAKNFLPAPGFL